MKINRYIVRYYNRFPADPKARWDIHRAEIYAASAIAAQFLIWHDGIEIIDVEQDLTYIQPVMKMMEIENEKM